MAWDIAAIQLKLKRSSSDKFASPQIRSSGASSFWDVRLKVLKPKFTRVPRQSGLNFYKVLAVLDVRSWGSHKEDASDDAYLKG